MISARSIKIAVAAVLASAMMFLVALGNAPQASAKPICIPLGNILNLQIAILEPLVNCPG
jgi:hypothetical protein